MDELLEMLDGLKDSLGGGLSSALDGLKSGLSGVTTQVDAAKNGLMQGRNELGQFTAAGTGASSSAGGLQTALAALGPEAQAAGAAIGVMTAALTVSVGAMLAASAAAISVTQELSLMASRFGALAGGAAGGKAVLDMVERLGTSLPFATSQIGEWAGALQRAGIAGKDLEAGVRAIAAAAALNPAGGAQAAQETLSKLAGGGKEATDLIKAIAEGSRKGQGAMRELGLTVEDLGGKAAVAKMSADQLSKAIEAALAKKGAGPLAEMGLTFGAIWQKAQEGVLSLFDKLGGAVKPFMVAVKSLFGEFSKGGGVINALKPVVTSVMTTLFAWGTKAVTAIHALVSGLTSGAKSTGVFGGAIAVFRAAWQALVSVFGVVKAALAPIIAAVMGGLGGKSGAMDTLRTIFTGIAVVLVVIAGAIGVVAAVWAVWLGVVYGTVAALVAFGAYVIGSVIDVMSSLAGIVSGATDALAGLPGAAMDAAGDFVAGLVQGIEAGIGAVIGAVTGLASGALGAFHSILEMHSPSAVLHKDGEENMAGAVAGGVDKGAPRVKASMVRMGEGAASTGAKGKVDGASGGGPSFTFTSCTFGAGMSEETVRELFARVWEEMAREAGGQPEPAT